MIGPPPAGVEVHRQTAVDLRFYVETEHDPSGSGTWQPCGVATTAAPWWCVVLNDTGIAFQLPADLLRWFLRTDDPTTTRYEVELLRSRGWMVDFAALVRSLAAQREREARYIAGE